MSILGIDYDKCSNCRICLTTCFMFRWDKEQEKVIFSDPYDLCNLCAHCIARCPEDAIQHEGIGEAFEYEGVAKPETIASYDTIYKFLRANRSVRLYKKKKVQPEILRKVFQAMENAPTGDNRRTENFSIISNTEQIKKLSDAIQEELLNNPLTKERYTRVFRILGKVFRSPIFFDAPHVIFIDSPEHHEVEANNIGIIITYGRLAAQALGLGTCWNGWSQIAMNSNPEIKKLANIDGKGIGAFIIGYPAVKFVRSPPRAPKEIKGTYR